MSTSESSLVPFHAGELALQERAGVRERMAAVGAYNIRRFMPDQHRQFFSELDLLFIGAIDPSGQPWATVLAGEPGFIASPTRTRLSVSLMPAADDPALEGFSDGSPIGLLGLMPQNRRRNRANGRLATVEAGGFSLDVLESFGNCPQYIQTRTRKRSTVRDRPEAEVSETLNDELGARIERADTFFIATASPEGVDVSHRGGRPGFVRVDEDGALLWPDFSGNNFFNTLGNLAIDPRAGLLFADFESGDLLQLAGTAETIWDGPELAAFRGAERLVRFTPSSVSLRRGALPLRFTPLEASPVLVSTGTWDEAAQTQAALAERDTWRPFLVARVEAESETIRSIYLRPADGGGIAPHRAGQYLPIRLTVPGADKALLRTYTLSDAAQPDHLRISVKREPGGAVSGYLHSSLKPGDRVEAMAPRGDFVLDRDSRRPVVLLSAGVGITPMIAMLNELVRDGIRTRNPREVYFIHGARDGSEQAFADHLTKLALYAPGVNLHIRFSRPRAQDVPGEHYASEGRVDVDLLRGLLPFGDYDFYLCGPGAFVADLHAGLRGLNVAADRIHYEFFGPSSLPSDAPEVITAEPAQVTFSASGKTVEWTAAAGSLLDLAEASGVLIDFSCRSGRCGTCAVQLLSGEIGYAAPPEAAVPDGCALVCQAHPVGPVSLGA